MVKFPSRSWMLIFVGWIWSVSYMASSWCFVFSYDYGWTCLGCLIRMVGSVRGIGWDCYKFRSVEWVSDTRRMSVFWVLKYLYFYLLGQPLCTARRYVVYVKHFTNLLSTVVRRFISVLVWTILFRTLWRTVSLFWLVYVLVCCLLWLLAFR
jgi:hypothetical protein